VLHPWRVTQGSRAGQTIGAKGRPVSGLRNRQVRRTCLIENQVGLGRPSAELELLGLPRFRAVPPSLIQTRRPSAQRSFAIGGQGFIAIDAKTELIEQFQRAQREEDSVCSGRQSGATSAGGQRVSLSPSTRTSKRDRRAEHFHEDRHLAQPLRLAEHRTDLTAVEGRRCVARARG
jgi:hypothetical protein